MNRTLATLATVAVLALVLSIFLGHRWKSRASERAHDFQRWQELYKADSADFVLRIAQLEDSLGKLGTIGDSLRAGWVVSREASGAAIITIRNLIAQLPQGQRAAVTVAIGTITEEREVCAALVTNCEARASAERSGRLEALARLRASDSLRTATSVMWQDAERRAGGKWSLALTGGYGLTLANNQVCTGASATIGVSYRLARLRLPWPF